MWGWNSHGQTGLIDANKVFIAEPTKLTIHDDQGREVKFKNLSLGARHSILIDENDNIYTFGWNKYGQLLQNELPALASQDDSPEEDDSVYEPMQVEIFNGRAQDVIASCWSSLILI